MLTLRVLLVIWLFDLAVYCASAEDKIKVTIVYKPQVCNELAEDGDKLTTEYVGYFPNGVKFDSTWDRGTPMVFTLGGGEVVKGAENDARGMCVGERHHTSIPPSLAYGNDDYGQIPGGSTLIFDSVLTHIEKGEAFTFSPGVDMDHIPLFN